jgi:hypothetical protein
MKRGILEMLRLSLAIIASASILGFSGCSRATTRPSAETSLSATSGDNPNARNRPFARENLTASRSNALADFIIPEVRMRLDAEPGSQDEQPEVSVQPDFGEPASGYDPETLPNEDTISDPDEMRGMRFSWARKKFGDALVKDPAAGGVLVLYADDHYYEVGRLLDFIAEGRDRIAYGSEIDPARIQVVYGGYRGLAQVEFWVVPEGQQMPEFKPEDRDAQAENVEQQ